MSDKKDLLKGGKEEDDEDDDISSNDDISMENDSDYESEEEDEDDINEVEIFKKNKTNGTNESDNEGEEEEDDEEDDLEEEEEEEDESYLQKFEKNLRSNVITEYHSELKVRSYEEIVQLTTVIRDDFGNIIDPLHKTLSVLTKYEYSRILGERAKQLSIGAEPLVKLEDYIFDEYSIALLELKEKKIPFIIERPMPNGISEFWKLEDLEILQV
jgi:DNA-directed RNA polymerase subunit K/omega